jgi:SAM-dependent methyltransferase
MVVAYHDLMLWGYSLQDYREMFALKDQDLQGVILDCYSGPASFNAELTTQGGRVVSVDPLFALLPGDMKKDVEKTFAAMFSNMKVHQERFLWDKISSLEEYAKIHRKNIQKFLDDYPQGFQVKRYQFYSLPHLPFSHFHFDIALCSHTLFSYAPDPSLDFHVEAIANLCDVAKEVRIFPLLDSLGVIPDLVAPITKVLSERNFGFEIHAVPYPLQKSGNAMLRICLQACEVK